MKKIYLFSILALLFAGMNSCKYEEGPFISFIPKTERVTNKWVVNNAIVNGTQSSTLDGFKSVTFFKEGGCTMILEFFGGDFGYTGTWVFSDDKAAIVLTLTDDATQLSTYSNTWTILHLKEKEMKVTYTEPDGNGGTDQYEVTFEPAS